MGSMRPYWLLVPVFRFDASRSHRSTHLPFPEKKPNKKRIL
jgi:hypothetical protein